jgi:hypothetical protein
MKLRNNLTLSLFSVFAGFLLWAQPATVRAQCSAPYVIDQRFPTNSALAEETRWRFCWQRVTKNGLVINAAFFRKSPTAPWVQIIYDARVIELFVPYHSGSPRFLDMSSFNFSLFQLTPKHCPAAAGGTLLDNNFVCKQVHDRGLAWNYIIEWTFRDDGVVLGQVGATATNFPPQPFETHMHGVFWRLDIDLNGFPGDSVQRVSHSETGLTANDPATLVRTESRFQWNPLAFTSLRIHDATLKNARGHASGYDLMPLRTGTPRHQEAFTKSAFGITKYKYSEMHVPRCQATLSRPNPCQTPMWWSGITARRITCPAMRMVGMSTMPFNLR